jgi:ribose 1,5-bisphosphokinase PhnN
MIHIIEQGVAIVLRGPRGAGKTPVIEELRSRLAIPSAFVRLDNEARVKGASSDGIVTRTFTTQHLS